MVATVGDRIKKDQGYAFYCYAPHAIWFMYDIVELEEPDFDPAKYKAVQPAQSADWYEMSKVETRDAPKNVQIAFSKSLQERSPAIAELLANIQLDTETVSAWAFEIAGKERDTAEVIREWMAANSERG